jgi:hypothetical protein
MVQRARRQTVFGSISSRVGVHIIAACLIESAQSWCCVGLVCDYILMHLRNVYTNAADT